MFLCSSRDETITEGYCGTCKTQRKFSTIEEHDSELCMSRTLPTVCIVCRDTDFSAAMPPAGWFYRICLYSIIIPLAIKLGYFMFLDMTAPKLFSVIPIMALIIYFVVYFFRSLVFYEFSRKIIRRQVARKYGY